MVTTFHNFLRIRYIGRNGLSLTQYSFKFKLHIIWDGHFQIKLIVLSKLHFYTDLVLLLNILSPFLGIKVIRKASKMDGIVSTFQPRIKLTMVASYGCQYIPFESQCISCDRSVFSNYLEITLQELQAVSALQDRTKTFI